MGYGGIDEETPEYVASGVVRAVPGPSRQEEVVVVDRPCPDRAMLMIAGASFPCTTMNDMVPEAKDHEGWGHSNKEAEAVWR